MLKIQEFINYFDSMKEANIYLDRNLNIKSKSYTKALHDKQLTFTLYTPGQNADMTDPLVREANCLVLDDEGDILGKAWDYPVVADNPREFPSDFNFGRGVVSEEVPDGSIVIVYNLDGKWVIGTRDEPHGTDYLPGMDLPAFTFDHEIKAHLTKRFGSWDNPFQTVNPMMCFIFNYVNPHARSVMPSIAQELYLMGAINLENDTEVSAPMVESLANKMEFARPIWSEVNGASSLKNRLDRMRALSPGLMLRDRVGVRVFIPNPIHTAVKSALDAGDRVCPTHIAKILKACRDKADMMTVEASYPDYGSMLRLLWSGRNDLYQSLLTLWNTVHKENDLKIFAGAVQHHPLNFILFKYRATSEHD